MFGNGVLGNGLQTLKNTITQFPGRFVERTKQTAHSLHQAFLHPPKPAGLDIHEESIVFNGKPYTFLSSGNLMSDYAIVGLHGLVGHMDNFKTQMQDPSFGSFANFAPNRLRDLPQQKIELGREAPIDQIIEYLYHFIQGVARDKKVFLHGASIGGEIAYKFAARYPDHIAGLILSGASGLQGEGQALGGMKIKNKERLQEQIISHFHNPKALDQETLDTMTEHLYHSFNDRNQSHAMMALAQTSKNPNIAENEETLLKIKEANIPVALLRGLNDKITPASTVFEKFRELTNADPTYTKIFTNAKHIPSMDESAADYNRHMKAFLNRHTFHKN